MYAHEMTLGDVKLSTKAMTAENCVDYFTGYFICPEILTEEEIIEVFCRINLSESLEGHCLDDRRRFLKKSVPLLGV